MENSILNLNILVLAYLGDCVYENYAKFIKIMIDSNFINELELSIVKRARNYKTTSHPKNCDIITYKYATGLEALIGYYDLINNNERIDEIMNFIFNCDIC